MLQYILGRARYKLTRRSIIYMEEWILLSQGSLVSKFKEEVNKAKYAPQIFLILYLLQSTWGVVSSVGRTLQVYCSP